MCTGANCNDTLQVNIPTAIPGADGASAYVYIASADTNTGSNFTYPQDETQPYIAVLNTTSPITSPAVGNFTGLWRKVNGTNGTNGTPGTNGADGVSSGLPYNFLNYALTGNPGSGNLSVSGSDVSTTNTISISYTTLATGNIQALLAALNTSGSSIKAFVKLTKKGDESKFVVYSLNTATDTGVYFSLSVNYLASSTVSPFVAGDDLYVEFYLTGDKGDKGDPGATGSFFIGTKAGGTQSYPATATQGGAYRFTGNGTISDNGAGVLNVKRFFEHDVLYCIADSTVSDGTKWFIWTGFPRGFFPGAGTDAFVQNTIAPGFATGPSAVCFNNNGTANGANSMSGGGSAVTGATSFGFGAASIVSNDNAFAAGAYAEATGQGSVALNNGARARAVYSIALGQNSLITAGATGALNASQDGLTGAVAVNSTALGKAAEATFPGEVVIGHGTYEVTIGKTNQAATRLIPQALVTAGATPTIMPFVASNLAGTGIAIPTNTAWMINGTVVASNAANGDTAAWTFKGVVRNQAGTTTIVGSFLYLDPVTGTYITTSTQFAADATMASPATALGISVSTPNLRLTVTGIAATNIRWSGKLEVEQVGWF